MLDNKILEQIRTLKVFDISRENERKEEELHPRASGFEIQQSGGVRSLNLQGIKL